MTEQSAQYQIKGHSYTVERFGVHPGGVAENPQAVQWLRAVAQGFHEEDPSEESLTHDLAWLRGAGTRLRAVHTADPVPPGALGADRPVATFCSWGSTLSLGGGALLPAWLVSDVTVRPTHTRRGLLRRLMNEDLGEAHREGFSVALLTASEATIYNRFGFGAGTFNTKVTVTAGSGITLKEPTVGRTELADNQAVARMAPEIFDRFHCETAGSVARTTRWWGYVSGQWNRRRAGVDPHVRTAVHYDEQDRADGYVSYRFVSGEDFKGALEIVDLVSPSARVRIALWEYLCGLDLVTEVRYDSAQMEDPLMWAMADMARYTVRKRYERLWLRVLDPVAALGARSYRARAVLTLSLADPMGFADGVYRLDTTGPEPVVERMGDRPRTHDADASPSTARVDLPDGADVAMDVDALGSLYLGAVTASTLHHAGLITVRDPEALSTLHAVMSTPVHPYCISPF